MLLTQNIREIAADERHIRCPLAAAGHPKLSVVLWAIHLLQITVGRLDVCDARSRQLLWQTALMRLKGSLAAPALLGRVGCNVTNPQLLEGPPKLREVDFVDFATRLGRGEVMRPSIVVQACK